MAKAYLVTIVPAALCSQRLRPNTSSNTSSSEAFFVSNGVGSDGQSADAEAMVAGEVRHLAVDLRSVTFIDLTTLALLLAASRHQQARGGKLLVLVGPQTPMTAFQVTGFDCLLAIRRGDDHPRDSAA
jgi:anti-anti-sigma factor